MGDKYKISVSFSESKKEEIVEEAERLGLNTASYCRMAIFKQLDSTKPYKLD